MRFFKSITDGAIIIAPDELEKFASMAGIGWRNENGDLVEFDEGELWDFQHKKVFDGKTWREYDAYYTPVDPVSREGDIIKVDPSEELTPEIEGVTYWDGHNWVAKFLIAKFFETGYEEITDEINALGINFSDPEETLHDVTPGITEKYYCAKDGSRWKVIVSRWQGDYFDRLEKVE